MSVDSPSQSTPQVIQERCIVVIGGGVAGVAAAKEAALRLASHDIDSPSPDKKYARFKVTVTLITATSTMKECISAQPEKETTSVTVTPPGFVEEVDLLKEVHMQPTSVQDWMQQQSKQTSNQDNDCPGIDCSGMVDEVIVGTVTRVNIKNKVLHVQNVQHKYTLTNQDKLEQSKQSTILDSFHQQPEKKTVLEISYHVLCIAVGSSPTSPFPPWNTCTTRNQSSTMQLPDDDHDEFWKEHVLTIRDTTSIARLAHVLLNSTLNTRRKHIVLYGNGAIALEVCHALLELAAQTKTTTRQSQVLVPRVTWIVRDHYIGHAMLDAAAASFLMPSLARCIMKKHSEDDVQHEQERQQDLESKKQGQERVTCEDNLPTLRKQGAAKKNRKVHVSDQAEPKEENTSSFTNQKHVSSKTTEIFPEGRSLGPDWRAHFRACTTGAQHDSIGKSSTAPILHMPSGGGAACPCCTPGKGIFALPCVDQTSEEQQQQPRRHNQVCQTVQEKAQQTAPQPNTFSQFQSQSKISQEQTDSGMHEFLEIQYNTSIQAVRRCRAKPGPHDKDCWVPIDDNRSQATPQVPPELHPSQEAPQEYQHQGENDDDLEEGEASPIEIALSNGIILRADAILSATGVSSRENVDAVLGHGCGGKSKKQYGVVEEMGDLGEGLTLLRGEDGGLVVDQYMRCQITASDRDTTQEDASYEECYEEEEEEEEGEAECHPSRYHTWLSSHPNHVDIFSAGDCADCQYFSTNHELWHAMKLWTQAKAGGVYAGRCMAAAVLSSMDNPLRHEYGHDANHRHQGHDVFSKNNRTNRNESDEEDELQIVEDEWGGSLGCGFDMFAHVTTFLGHKVTLLGLFNGQNNLLPSLSSSSTSRGALSEFVPDPGGCGLFLHDKKQDEDLNENDAGARSSSRIIEVKTHNDKNDIDCHIADSSDEDRDGENAIQILTRFTPNREYVKLVVKGGRIVGAVIVGNDSDLEETVENLMLSRVNLRALGVDVDVVLDPNVDLSDFFD